MFRELRKKRRELEITVAEVAGVLGVSPSRITTWERGYIPKLPSSRVRWMEKIRLYQKYLEEKEKEQNDIRSTETRPTIF